MSLTLRSDGVDRFDTRWPPARPCVSHNSFIRGALMDSVLRAAAIYLVLMILFKIAGRRSLAELTTFDLVLLMVIG